MFLILVAAASVWMLAGVFVFITVVLAAWHRGRRERVEMSVPAETSAGRAQSA